MSKEAYVEVDYRCPRCKMPFKATGTPVFDKRYRLRTFVPKHEHLYLVGLTCPASTRGHTLTPRSGQVIPQATTAPAAKEPTP